MSSSSKYPLLNLLRMAAGITLLLIGIIGLFLPILQGWLLILVAIPLISPEHGKRMAEKLREWLKKGKEKNRTRKLEIPKPEFEDPPHE